MIYNLPSVSLDARWTPLHGGSINEVYRVVEPDGASMVVKVNQSNRYPGMFAAESAGLQMLRSYVNVPQVLGLHHHNGHDFLVLEDLGDGSSAHIKADFFTSLGEQLAQMHEIPQTAFGLHHDNYIGSLPQSNTAHNEWSLFFQHERLTPLVKKAFDAGLLTKAHLRQFECLYSMLPTLFPKEPPALLHGDLWSGNVHCSQAGNAFFVDPAVYIGHREMDLAMTRLFGGFSDSFYDAYQTIYPLEKGWENRVALCNIYPNLVHLVLFGKGYLSGVERGLSVCH